MSDVVATILLLALTVTLFASIFAFVTTFPSPPAQNNNQFQASLVYTGNLTWIAGLHILHLAGPSVPGTALIYLKSSTQPAATEFANPYTVASQSLAWGNVTGENTWSLGQVWNLTFNTHFWPRGGSNITVYIVSGSQLVFSVILPGTTIAPPPTVASTWITPATPTIGTIYTVYATVTGSYTANSVYVNLAAVPGGPSSAKLMTQNSQGVWTYSPPSGATTNGTFYGFVNASNGAGQQSTGLVVITIYPSGGSTNGPLSVGVVLVPSPPNSATTESVQAVVTYTGTVTGAGLTVSFTGTSNPSGYTFSGSGPSGLTISGPASKTVASQTTWTIPNPTSLYTYTVSATATVAGVGTVTGTTTFTPALLTASSGSFLVGSGTPVATGQAFAPSTGVNLTLGGVLVTPTFTSSAGLCPQLGSTGAILTSATGGFTCSFTVPAGSPYGASVPLLATDSTSGQNDVTTLSVTQWTLVVTTPSNATGPLGYSVKITGLHFSTAAGSSVTVTFDGVATSCGAITPTGVGGGFNCTFAIPLTATAGEGSPVPIVATDATWSQTGTASFTVYALTVSPLVPTSGLVGSSVTVSGSGFGLSAGAGTAVALTFDGIALATAAPTSLACTVDTSVSGNSVTTNAYGAFKCTFNVPYAATAGPGSLTAADATTSQVASSSYSVTPWTLTLNPTTSAVSVTITVTGAGFAAGSVVSISNNGVTGDYAWNAACTTGTGASGAYSVTTSGTGAFVCTLAWTAIAHVEILTFTAADSTTGQVAMAYFSDTD